ncbi:MAG: ribosome-associated translation inhibitor RaiA, partial [Chloroflexi bacterium]|nr:ribosome-associated translation inhibitor RaiA [Chloroflexota bacterium]
MELQIFARNMKLSERSEDYIQKKVARLERHLRERADAKLELSRTASRSETDRFVAQMTISASGSTLRGQESGLTLFAAVDSVADVMDKQIRRYKGRAYRTSQARRSARTQAMREDVGALIEELAAVDEEEQDESFEETGKVVRVKRFSMKPMSVEDAIMEMELLDHDFFL